MARTIAVANHKGGVGKTTTVINLGVGLAELGQRTLVVDLDPQCALTAGLGVDNHRLEATIWSAMLDPDFPVQEVVLGVRTGLDLVPANRELDTVEDELFAELGREFILDRVLKPLKPQYDLILIDCPPSLRLLTLNALCASSEVLIPLQCEYLAMRGMRLLLDEIERIRRRLNPGLDIVGVLATMYATGTVHAREVLQETREVFGEKVFDAVVYKSIRFPEASVAGLAIGEYADGHKGAAAYRELAKELLARGGPNAGQPDPRPGTRDDSGAWAR
jgi:chromosome partitioning protein